MHTYQEVHAGVCLYLQYIIAEYNFAFLSIANLHSSEVQIYILQTENRNRT